MSIVFKLQNMQLDTQQQYYYCTVDAAGSLFSKQVWNTYVNLSYFSGKFENMMWDLLSACRPFFKISYVSSNRLVVLTGLSGHFPSNLKEVLIEAFLSGTDELMSDMTWQLNSNNQSI